MTKELFELLLSTPELLAFDNGEDDDGGGDDSVDTEGGEGEDSQSKEGEGAQNKERTFTQKDVDEIVVKRNKKVKAQLEQMERNYQKLLKEQGMSAEMRAQLEKDLDDVRAQMMTKEEKLKAEKKRTELEYQERVKQVESERDEYRLRFESSTINRAISDAQQKHQGYNSDQFIALLGPKSQIVEELDAKGEKTGQLVPRIQWNVSKEDGTVEKVLLTPDEAVERMKEDTDQYGNMFRPNIATGVGGGTAPGTQSAMTGKVDQKRISDDEYFAMRKKDPSAFRRQVGLSR